MLNHTIVSKTIFYVIINHTSALEGLWLKKTDKILLVHVVNIANETYARQCLYQMPLNFIALVINTQTKFL